MTKQEEIKMIPEHKSKVVTFICDTCGKKLKDTSWGKMKQCHVCKEDVCRDCAIITDHWYLEDGSFSGDYPDYYCPKCWGIGVEIQKGIQEARDKEGELWEQWHKLAV